MNNEPKPVAPIPPFKAFCGRIGAFPTAFTDSMTVYECLAWLYKYLDGCITPTLNANVTAVAELKDYVEHYFDNLDVQEEINNKLDAMAESGELTDLIAGYLNLRGILAYDTVASMKSADNLVDGSFAETYGFYAKGDKGGAKYKVRQVTNADTVDEITLIALADEDLVAELMVEDTMCVEQFGAKGDGTTDDTAKINKGLATCTTLLFAKKTYLVDASVSITPNSGNQLIFGDATITTIPNGLETYATINIDGVHDVLISSGKIVGENTEHLDPTTGEFGHCISIDNGSYNVRIEGCELTNGRGDGIILKNNVNDVIIDKIKSYDNRRNGLSLVYCTDVDITNSTFDGSIGLDEGTHGIDIEPNNSQYVRNVNISGVVCKNNSGAGVNLYHRYYANHPDAIQNINLSNVIVSGNTYGVNLAYSQNVNLDNVVANTNEYGVNVVSGESNNLNNITCKGNSVYGLRFNTANRVTCTNSNISGNDSNIHLTSSTHITIANSLIYGNTGNTSHNIFIEMSNDCQIANNEISDSQRAAISFNTSGSSNDAARNFIVNNKIYSNSLVSSGANPAINMVKNTKDNVIANNIFTGGSDYESYVVSIASGCTGNIIKENIMNTKQTGVIFGSDANIHTLNNIVDGALVTGTITA